MSTSEFWTQPAVSSRAENKYLRGAHAAQQVCHYPRSGYTTDAPIWNEGAARIRLFKKHGHASRNYFLIHAFFDSKTTYSAPSAPPQPAVAHLYARFKSGRDLRPCGVGSSGRNRGEETCTSATFPGKRKIAARFASRVPRKPLILERFPLVSD